MTFVLILICNDNTDNKFAGYVYDFEHIIHLLLFRLCCYEKPCSKDKCHVIHTYLQTYIYTLHE